MAAERKEQAKLIFDVDFLPIQEPARTQKIAALKPLFVTRNTQLQKLCRGEVMLEYIRTTTLYEIHGVVWLKQNDDTILGFLMFRELPFSNAVMLDIICADPGKPLIQWFIDNIVVKVYHAAYVVLMALPHVISYYNKVFGFLPYLPKGMVLQHHTIASLNYTPQPIVKKFILPEAVQAALEIITSKRFKSAKSTFDDPEMVFALSVLTKHKLGGVTFNAQLPFDYQNYGRFGYAMTKKL